MAGRFAFTVDAAIENIPVVADGIEDYLVSAGVNPAIVPDIELAVDEVMTNIITHGFRRQAGTIGITCSIGEGVVRIEIRDRAPAFNPLLLKEPDISVKLEDRPVGGLGIYLVRKVMDAVSYEYRDGENVLTLEKKIPE
ncbi:MAG: serine-protein kinase RsbW [Methanoregula sp. PtaU1.Bin051]|nr:MAG: serine-protein kinase RsbW [Methanoregula sp. PtaU1.Bin051]